MTQTARYIRQTIFPPLGEAGQARLGAATVVLVGCGATGTALANLLARMGVGRLRIIDRDFIELNNLQRQTLFDEDDIDADLPKAEAAARKLRVVNRDIEIEAVVTDVNAGNVLALIGDATRVNLNTLERHARMALIASPLQEKQGMPPDRYIDRIRDHEGWSSEIKKAYLAAFIINNFGREVLRDAMRATGDEPPAA